MKKLLPYLILIIVIVLAAWGGYYFSRGSGVKTIRNLQQPFLWGTTMRPFALAVYSKSNWAKQLDLQKNAGIQYARVGWVNDSKYSNFQFHDALIKAIKDKGLSVYFGFEDNNNIFTVADPYQAGYDMAYKISNHYKGQIKYYQLLNEAASGSLKGGQYSGENQSDYDMVKYNKTKEWLKGASDGIKKGDPAANRIITDQWLHFAFFEMLKRDGVNYDILGWDWFSDMGFMGDKLAGDGRAVLDHLKDFNKPIILVEVNARPEGKNGQGGQNEDKQAAFIQQMADWAYGTGVIKGFFVHELIDSQTKTYTDYYGLISVKKDEAGKIVPGEPRKAYYVLKDIIAKYNKQ